MESPLITIIVAVFNGSKTIQRCIDSVVCQNYPRKELIIIDGGSTDGTINILKSNQINITYWESKPDRGLAHAWNKALLHAHGDWILFLGADDYFFEENSLSIAASYLKQAETEDIRIAYGQVKLMTPSGDLLGIRGKPWENAKKRFFFDNRHIHHQGVFHHKNIFRIHGPFDEFFRDVGCDYEMLLRELKTGKALFIPHIVTVATTGGVSWSIHSVRNVKIMKYARKKNGLSSLSFGIILLYCKAIVVAILSYFLGHKRFNKLMINFKKVNSKAKVIQKIP
jgi:glycosyltransferase involved in cell wall biosynthesis